MAFKFTKKELLSIMASKAEWVINGNELVSWLCPYCKKPNLTQKPNEKRVWDSTTICVQCNNCSFVAVNHKGQVKVNSLP